MEANFCIEALKEALAEYGKPEIMNSDQGSQFTGFEWTQALKDAGVRISMDGRGRWIDNRMIERLWRSLKYECVYLRAFETGSEARAGIGQWMAYYNADRPHSTHGILTPDEAYESKTEPLRMAA
jgi:putative transposase